MADSTAEKKENEKDKEWSTPPYSYHTFLFPFIWNANGKTFRDLLDALKYDGNWKKSAFADVEDKENYCLDYAKYQYLTPAMRKIAFSDLFPDEEPTVKNFIYSKNGKPLHGNADYLIQKTVKQGSAYLTETFKLRINRIRLRVFPLGIAVFTLELEYHGEKSSVSQDEANYRSARPALQGTAFQQVQFSLDDINKINEHGRRICLPYIGTKEFPCILTADRIAIVDESGKPLLTDEAGESRVSADFLGQINDVYDGNPKGMVLTHIMDPITGLLGPSFTSNPDHAKSGNKILLCPAIDDRMFVCCLVRGSGGFFDQLQRWDAQAGEYAYLSDCKSETEAGLSSRLYKTIYIENDVSCQSKSMKHDLLKKNVYDRWIDYGTLYAVTHHSLVCIVRDTGESSAGLQATVYNPFLTQYIELANLVLAQRAAILALSNEAARVSAAVNADDTKALKKIEDLQKKYVQVQSQMMLFEVTAQEQGVEIFRKLTEQLYIPENNAALDREMENLRSVEDISNNRLERHRDENLNTLIWSISLVGLFWAALDALPAVFQLPTWLAIFISVLAAVGLPIGVAWILQVVRNHRDQ